MFAISYMVAVACAAKGLTVPAYHDQNDYNQVLKVNATFDDNQKTLFAVPNANIISLKESLTSLFENEKVKFGETELNDVPVNKQDSAYAILSFGYGLWNQTDDSSSDLAKNWFLGSLVDNGVINEAKFSLAPKGDQWEFLFGGVDHKKYSGELKELDIWQYTPLSNYTNKFVRSDIFGTTKLSGFSIAGTSDVKAKENLTFSILYNYGDAADLVLPEDVYQDVAKALKFDADKATGDCVKDDKKKIDFDFDGRTISVPYQALQKKNKDGKCDISITGLKDNTLDFYVGPMSLKYFYAVFDADAKKALFAQYQDLSSSNIEIFGGLKEDSGSSTKDDSNDKKNDSQDNKSQAKSNAGLKVIPNASILAVLMTISCLL